MMKKSYLALTVLLLSTAFAFGQTDAISISSDGNVGVGTQTPSAKLEVAGDIKVQGQVLGNIHVVPATGATYTALRNLLEALTPVGTIQAFGGTKAPEGWLICDGSFVSTTTYAELFSVIGYNFGKNGSNLTVFQLPDLRGQFLRGVTGAATTDPDVATRTVNGNGTANAPGSKQADIFGTHTHNIPTTNGVSGAGYEVPSAPSTNYDYVPGVPTTSAGGNETRPKNVYVNFIIKI